MSIFWWPCLWCCLDIGQWHDIKMTMFIPSSHRHACPLLAIKFIENVELKTFPTTKIFVNNNTRCQISCKNSWSLFLNNDTDHSSTCLCIRYINKNNVNVSGFASRTTEYCMLRKWASSPISWNTFVGGDDMGDQSEQHNTRWTRMARSI